MEGTIEQPVARAFLMVDGRLVGAHRVLCSAAEIPCKGRQDFYLGHGGGYMISDSQQNWSRNDNPFCEIGDLVWKKRAH